MGYILFILNYDTYNRVYEKAKSLGKKVRYIINSSLFTDIILVGIVVER